MKQTLFLLVLSISLSAQKNIYYGNNYNVIIRDSTRMYISSFRPTKVNYYMGRCSWNSNASAFIIQKDTFFVKNCVMDLNGNEFYDGSCE